MASIQKRISKTGEITYRIGARTGGKLKWTPPVLELAPALEIKALAERLGIDAAISILETRSGRTAGTHTVADELELYLRKVEGYASRGTAPEYRRLASRSWLPRLGNLPLDALTAEMVTDWIGWQRKQETAPSVSARAKARRERTELPPPQCWSPKSIRNAHGLLSAVLNNAIAAERLSRNVARGVKIPGDAQTAEKEIFTTAEFARFLDCMTPHYIPLTVFLVATGARLGEATALQGRDFDLNGQPPVVHIRRAWKHDEKQGRYLGAPKSRRSVRTIVLDPATISIIRDAVSQARGEALVFRTITGSAITSKVYGQDHFKPALQKAGISKRLTPHSLRHTSASWQLMQGVPAQVVQMRLGHESLQTTSKTYAHLLLEAQLSATAVFSQVAGSRNQIES